MKKVILTLGLGLCLTSVFSQSSNTEERMVGATTKSGQKILPQAGDFAIGIDATSLLNYVGNSFNGFGTDKSVKNDASDIFSAPAFYGKYFLSDNSALRVKLNIGVNGYTDKMQVPIIPNNGDEKVENQTKYRQSIIGLTAGYEVRRGYGRLQGFFGPELSIGSMSGSVTYDYGNPLSSNNWRSRPLSQNLPSLFTFGSGVFAGVEYFVAPKLSLGGEARLGFLLTNESKSKLETETWTGSSVKIETEQTGGGSRFDISTAYSGAISVMFHF